MVEIKILSHACVLIRSSRSAIVIDPWLVGSCYWRSWWNYPAPSVDADELAAVDAVVISHIHWDHWHGPSLKKYLRGKKVLVPDEPGLRSEHDLRTIGFDNVVRTAHGQTVQVGDIAVTMYQFGLYLNDAAVVVEAEGVRIIDANDAKIAGSALRQVAARHGTFDLALRSHSSANARICYRVDGEDLSAADDREHYFRSFVAFMDVLRPRHAIPFASNHCHLHEDVYALNPYVSNPIELGQWIARQPGQRPWQYVPMLPGSRWTSTQGFELRNADAFDDLPAKLAAYRDSVSDRLQAYTRQENSVVIGESLMNRFLPMLRTAAQGTAEGNRVALTLYWPDGREVSYRLEPAQGRATPCDPVNSASPGMPLMRFPAIVFRDAVVKNMFHHAVISKRCQFTAVNATDLDKVRHLMGRLGLAELGASPMTAAYARRLALAYVRRWRELVVYVHALWLIRVRRKPLYLAEEAILRGEF